METFLGIRRRTSFVDAPSQSGLIWGEGHQTNYGATVGVQGVRETFLNPSYSTINRGTVNDAELGKQSSFGMAWATQVAADEQVERILALLDEGQGAL